MPAGPFAPGLGGGGEWRSDSIASLVADFDSRIALSHSGGEVTQWDAHIGLAYSFTPPGVNAPAREATGWTAATSGLVFPSIRFDSTNDQLSCTNTVGGIALANRLIGGTDQPGTIILVGQLVTWPGTDPVASSIIAFTKVGLGVGDQRFSFAARVTEDAWRVFKQDDAAASAFQHSVATPDTAPHVLAIRHSGTSVRLRVDATEVINGAHNVGQITVDRVELSATYNTNNGYMRLVRAIFFSTELSDSDMDAAVAGLTALYL
jgi:hypothetical protein